MGSDLIVSWGKPEEIIFALAYYFRAIAIYCNQKSTDEVSRVEDALDKHLETIQVPLEFFRTTPFIIPPI